MDKAITTILLLIAGIVCTVLVINTVYPAVNRSTAAMVTIAGKADERIQTNVEIIQTAVVDTNVHVWVKNIGTARILAIEQSDLFFGVTGAQARVPYGSGSPFWDYQIENNTEWTPMATVRFTVHLASAPSGNYVMKLVLANGISDEYVFSV
jgi:archaellum component FlaG (FlaF/FlaG flagellin family)